MQSRMHRRTRSNPITVSDAKILNLEGDIEKPDQTLCHKRSISTDALLPPVDNSIKDDSQSRSVFFTNNASLLATVQKIKKTLCRLSPSRKSKHSKMKNNQGSGDLKSIEGNNSMKLHPETGDNLNDKESHIPEKKTKRPQEPSPQLLSPPKPAPRRSNPHTSRKTQSSSQPHVKFEEQTSSKNTKSNLQIPNQQKTEQPGSNHPVKQSKAYPESSVSNQTCKQQETQPPSNQSNLIRKPPNNQAKHHDSGNAKSSNQSQIQIISRRPKSQPSPTEKPEALPITQPFQIIPPEPGVVPPSSMNQRRNNSTTPYTTTKKSPVAKETKFQQTNQQKQNRRTQSSSKGKSNIIVDRNAHSNVELETDLCKIQLPNYVREQWVTINEMKDKIETLTAENKETRKQVHLLRRIKKDLEDMLTKTSEENRELVVTCDMLRDKHVRRPAMHSKGTQVSSYIENDGQSFCIRCQRNQHHLDNGIRCHSRGGLVPSLRDETICLEIETQNIVNHINSLARTVDRHCTSNKRFRFKVEKIIHGCNIQSSGTGSRALKYYKKYDPK